MSQLKNFVTAQARPLPVIILADTSGSMASNGKIASLNTAIKTMLDTFSSEDTSQAEIHVSIITFSNNDATIHSELMPAKNISWSPLQAYGGTPMGKAFSAVTDMIEDKSIIPSRAYRPVIVLVSDGEPTDDWQAPLNTLLQSERAKKATRFAMAIGDDADETVLEKFLANNEERVYRAHEATDISKFFRYVSMSVTVRSRSVSPNEESTLSFSDLADYDF